MNVIHRRTGLVLVAAILALSGCSAESRDTAGNSSKPQPPAAGADAAAEYDAGKQLAPAPAAPGEKAPPAKVAANQRSLVYKGELTVKVKNVDKAADDAGALAERLEGYVAGDKRNRSGDDSSADVTLRIPGKAFSDGVDGAAKLGEEITRDYSTDDVTEALVDIDARIVSQKASVDRVRTLLSRAEKITDLASVERELGQRESELASLEAQQRSMAGQVEFSTVTLHLVGPSAKIEKPDDDDPTFLSALGAGWDALKAVVNGILVAFGATLPFLIALGLPLGLAFWLLRRRRAQARATAKPADAPAAP